MLQGHKEYVNTTHMNQPTGFQSNKPGNTLNYMKIIFIEEVQKIDTF